MGLAKFTWLNTLYALAPTVNASLSWKWKVFFSPRSALKNPGPRNEFRGIVPKVVTADPLANCEAEKQAVFTLAPPQAWFTSVRIGKSHGERCGKRSRSSYRRGRKVLGFRCRR